MTDLLATREDIEQLTGAKTRAGQREWLTSRGWRFETDRTGWPVVLRGEIEAHLLSEPRTAQDGWALNFDDAA